LRTAVLAVDCCHGDVCSGQVSELDLRAFSGFNVRGFGHAIFVALPPKEGQGKQRACNL